MNRGRYLISYAKEWKQVSNIYMLRDKNAKLSIPCVGFPLIKWLLLVAASIQRPAAHWFKHLHLDATSDFIWPTAKWHRAEGREVQQVNSSVHLVMKQFISHFCSISIHCNCSDHGNYIQSFRIRGKPDVSKIEKQRRLFDEKSVIFYVKHGLNVDVTQWYTFNCSVFFVLCRAAGLCFRF